MTNTLQVTNEFDGTSAKTFCKKHVDIPYRVLIKKIKEKRITLNGKKIKDGDLVRTGDEIKLWQDSLQFRTKEIKEVGEAKNLHIQTLFENEDLLILNKLPGVVVQGAQHNDLSLSFHLRHLEKENSYEGDFRYFHVHRIDKETSGALVCAKNLIALRELNALFRTRNVKKIYTCLCIGSFNETQGEIKVHLKRNPEGIKQKVSVCPESDNEAKLTHSRYKVLKELEFENETLSLVEVEIFTGFMHQIRVHMFHLNHPIIADSMYGNSYVNSLIQEKLERQFLHASLIEFKYKDKNIQVKAPLTQDLKEFLELCE